MKRNSYVENGGILGYINMIVEIFEKEINEIMDNDKNEFQNKVQVIINYMNENTLSELLQGYKTSESKIIEKAYVIARKKLLKRGIQKDLKQRISQSLEQGSNLEEVMLKMQSDMAIVEMYGEMSDEDKEYISKCVTRIFNDMQKQKNNINRQKEAVILNAMQEVEPQTLKNMLNVSETTTEKESYLDEVSEFTNGFKFLCEDSDVYSAKTGYRRKFHNWENYEKFYKLRRKLKEIVNMLVISECEVINLILKGPTQETNSSIYGLDKNSRKVVMSLVKQLFEELQVDQDNQYILEQFRSQMMANSIEDKEDSTGDGR